MANKFDWKKFHKNLDFAIATMMNESTKGNMILPSNTTMLEFMRFSCKKSQEQK